MAWPKGKPRKIPASTPESIGSEGAEIVADTLDIEAEPAQYPTDWHPGMLLNVRNTGADYTITLFPEEYDPRHPERALRFTNPGEAQDFVSRWYSRQSHDPRAG